MGSLQELADMKTSLIVLTCLVAFAIAEPQKHPKGGSRPDYVCFPGPPPRGCPPVRNTRIVVQKYYDLSRRRDFNECWNHCKELASDTNIGCYAWTFDLINRDCYTYNTLP